MRLTLLALLLCIIGCTETDINVAREQPDEWEGVDTLIEIFDTLPPQVGDTIVTVRYKGERNVIW